jgi:hypothetical protein
MKEKYIPGGGCLCHAHSEAECGCDVDWTPREVYELREQRDRLLEEREQWRMSSVCRELREQRDMLAEVAQAVWDRWETPLWKDHPPTALVMNKLRDALAAVKGGSDDN